MSDYGVKLFYKLCYIKLYLIKDEIVLLYTS